MKSFLVDPLTKNYAWYRDWLTLNKEWANLTARYDNFILPRDFNLTVGNKNLNSFMNFFNLQKWKHTKTKPYQDYQKFDLEKFKTELYWNIDKK